MGDNNKKDKFVGLDMPENWFQKIKKEADKQQRSLSAQIRFILKEWLDKDRS